MKKQFPLFAAIAFTFFFFGMGSCDESAKVELCHQKLPQFNERLSNAIMALKTWSPEEEGQGRSIASILEMAAADRDTWANWTETELKMSQEYIDRAAEDIALAEIKHQLSESANALVILRAYAAAGDVKKMILTLKKIKEQNLSLTERICSS